MAVEIEVFADVWCPFAYVGLLRLFELREVSGSWRRRHPGPGLAARARQRRAHGGGQGRGERGHAQGPGGPPALRRPLRGLLPDDDAARPGPRRVGLRAQLGHGGGRQPPRPPPALRGGSRRLEPEVLAQVAGELGIEPGSAASEAAVLESLEEGRRRGVIGSPHFFCGELESFCPSLEISRDDAGVLLVAPTQPSLTAFVERCFSEVPLRVAG